MKNIYTNFINWINNSENAQFVLELIAVIMIVITATFILSLIVLAIITKSTLIF